MRLDLAKCEVYVYTQSKDFEMLFGYAFDDEAAKAVDLKKGEKLPKRVWMHYYPTL